MANDDVDGVAEMAGAPQEDAGSSVDGRYLWLAHRISASLKTTDAAFDRLMVSENRCVRGARLNKTSPCGTATTWWRL